MFISSKYSDDILLFFFPPIKMTVNYGCKGYLKYYDDDGDEGGLKYMRRLG